MRYEISFFQRLTRRALKPHDLRAARPVAQRLERNRRLDRPAAVEPADLQLPDRVPVACCICRSLVTWPSIAAADRR